MSDEKRVLSFVQLKELMILILPFKLNKNTGTNQLQINNTLLLDSSQTRVEPYNEIGIKLEDPHAKTTFVYLQVSFCNFYGLSVFIITQWALTYSTLNAKCYQNI